MKRIQEKVKDLIEVRKYDHLLDFLVEPERTVSNYRYTPVTSVLMANWIDSLVSVEENKGAAQALAGYRGVGKSHFLGTLGAILAYPELRLEINDSHVASSVHHLRRRHYPVTYVKRGSKDTLFEELRLSIADTFEMSVSDLPEDLPSLMSFAAEKAGDLPFVIIVDTALERETRVSRDDGKLLGELAHAAASHSIFIGVALDDDITDADGVNSAIASAFTIDYLDQEHLYQIVNSHIFPKHRQTESLVQELYHEFRDTYPSFRWSEERFKSLYPLHPSILEVAPFVRFYASDFALLGFASKAGARILGRPANSMISLDEVFDNAEATLRKSKELRSSFEIYDRIGAEIITKLPVLIRLQSKLVLKAFFILSLDGGGVSSGEISEAMLIREEGKTDEDEGVIGDLLAKYAEAFPDDILRKSVDGGDVRYSFVVEAKDDLAAALEESVSEVDDSLIPDILRRIASNRISDWSLSSDTGNEQVNSSEHRFLWRGGYRNSRLFWNWSDEFAEPFEDASNSGVVDLDILITKFDASVEAEGTEVDRVIWQTAELSPEEIVALKRFSVLISDDKLRADYSEQVKVATHKNLIEAEKVWERIFLKDAKLLVDGKEYEVVEDACDKQAVSDLFSAMFEPIFDDQYPEHPVFDKPLEMEDVSEIVSGLFCGTQGSVAEVQKLAATHAFPLGLVRKSGEEFVLKSDEEISKLPLAKGLLELVGAEKDTTVSLREIYAEWKQKPFGLVREAQHLVLAALVANRLIEFVTARGDRINHRSLDLQIIWNDIVGVAEPQLVDFDGENLIRWAQYLVPIESVKTLNTSAERSEVKVALSTWLGNWEISNVLERFDSVPDEVLNTKIWYIFTKVGKAFGVVANTIKLILEDKIELEDGLQRIADTFFDSEREFNQCEKDLVTLTDFIDGADMRAKIWSYLAICDLTKDKTIEESRSELLCLIDETYESPSAEKNLEMEDLWQKFHAAYVEHFTVRHNAIMNSRQLKREFEEIQKSDEWWEFESLSKLPIFKDLHWKRTRKILRQFRALECGFDLKENLNLQPFCACAFNLAQMTELAKLSKTLSKTMKTGRKSYRNTLYLMNKAVTKSMLGNANVKEDKGLKAEAVKLVKVLENSGSEKLLSHDQLSILHLALNAENQSATVQISFPSENKLYTSEELRESLNAWVDDLPNDSILLKV